MQHWGHTSTGKTRWFCRFCSKSSVLKRPDTAARWQLGLFQNWLIGTEPLSAIAYRKSCTVQTLKNWFSRFWAYLPGPIIPQSLSGTYLVVDAVYLEGHNECVLIGRTGSGNVFWMFSRQETLLAWHGFITKIPKPRALVCDGQSGLFAAVKALWADVPVQRCLAHIQRLGIQKLTLKPRTAAGLELLKLVYRLHGVKTPADRAEWHRDFAAWDAQWEDFLRERTCGIHPNGRKTWWYTHRRIRGMRNTLKQSMNNLFVYLDYPGVPSTTNLVEGGINSRLKELLHRHRGMSLEHRKVVVAHFLKSRNVPRKPTRNFN